jgi:hypothetical protein
MVLGDFDTATDNADKSDTTKFENLDEPQANENVDKDKKTRNDLDAVSTSISDGSVVVKKSDFLHWIGDICEFRQWNCARYGARQLWCCYHLSKHTINIRHRNLFIFLQLHLYLS